MGCRVRRPTGTNVYTGVEKGAAGSESGTRIARRRAEEEGGDVLFVPERRRRRRTPKRNPQRAERAIRRSEQSDGERAIQHRQRTRRHRQRPRIDEKRGRCGIAWLPGQVVLFLGFDGVMLTVANDHRVQMMMFSLFDLCPGRPAQRVYEVETSCFAAELFALDLLL